MTRYVYIVAIQNYFLKDGGGVPAPVLGVYLSNRRAIEYYNKVRDYHAGHNKLWWDVKCDPSGISPSLRKSYYTNQDGTSYEIQLQKWDLKKAKFMLIESYDAKPAPAPTPPRSVVSSKG